MPYKALKAFCTLISVGTQTEADSFSDSCHRCACEKGANLDADTEAVNVNLAKSLSDDRANPSGDRAGVKSVTNILHGEVDMEHDSDTCPTWSDGLDVIPGIPFHDGLSTLHLMSCNASASSSDTAQVQQASDDSSFAKPRWCDLFLEDEPGACEKAGSCNPDMATHCDISEVDDDSALDGCTNTARESTSRVSATQTCKIDAHAATSSARCNVFPEPTCDASVADDGGEPSDMSIQQVHGSIIDATTIAAEQVLSDALFMGNAAFYLELANICRIWIVGVKEFNSICIRSHAHNTRQMFDVLLSGNRPG